MYVLCMFMHNSDTFWRLFLYFKQIFYGSPTFDHSTVVNLIEIWWWIPNVKSLKTDMATLQNWNRFGLIFGLKLKHIRFGLIFLVWWGGQLSHEILKCFTDDANKLQTWVIQLLEIKNWAYNVWLIFLVYHMRCLDETRKCWRELLNQNVGHIIIQ